MTLTYDLYEAIAELIADETLALTDIATMLNVSLADVQYVDHAENADF